MFLAGPDKSLPPESAFSQAHYDHVIEFWRPAQLDRYQTFFLDSITQLSRWCFAWCRHAAGCHQRPLRQARHAVPTACSARKWSAPLTHLQHARGKNVVFVAILDERLDDYNRKVFVPQIEGSKTSLELPGIVDEVVTLAEIKAEDGSAYRAFVTHTVNPYGFPGQRPQRSPRPAGAAASRRADRQVRRLPPLPTPSAPPPPQNHRIRSNRHVRNWNDFNDADPQQSGFDLIPKGRRRAGAHDHQARWL